METPIPKRRDPCDKRGTKNWSPWLLALASLAIALMACATKPLPPTITSFTADPTDITIGQSNTLSWTVTGTAPITLTIDHGVGDVTGQTSTTVSPTTTTTYTLTATNTAGTDTAQATITVNHAPVLGPIDDQEVIRNFWWPNRVDLTFGVSDPDGDPVVVTASSNDQLVVPDGDLSPLCDAGTCSLTFTPDSGANADVILTVTATDGLDSSSVEFALTVTARLVTNPDDAGPGSLRQTLEDARVGDVVGFDTDGLFASATTIALTTGPVNIHKDLILEGPGQDRLTVDAESNSQVLTITPSVERRHGIVVQDITFAHGQYGSPGDIEAWGGGVSVYAGLAPVTLRRVTIRDSVANQGGGLAIFGNFPLQRDPLGMVAVIEDSVITGNAATFQEGGGVLIDVDCRCEADVTIRNSHIDQNVTDVPHACGGAGVAIYGASVLIEGSTVNDNTVTVTTGDGTLGAILSGGDALTLDDTDVANNNGGGLYVGGEVTLRNGTTVHDNESSGSGAGVHFGGGNLLLDGSAISSNTTTSVGGGIYVTGGTMTLQGGATVTGNSAGIDGGGIYVESGSLVGAVAGGNVSGNVPNDISQP